MEETNLGHVVNRPMSSAKSGQQGTFAPVSEKVRKRRARLSPNTDIEELPNGYKCIARVQDVCIGNTNEYPAKSPYVSAQDCETNYTILLREYQIQKESGLEQRWDVDIYENVASPQHLPSSVKLSSFEFGSEDSIEVRMLRDFRELQFFRYPKSLEEEKVFWTVRLFEDTRSSMENGYQWWNTLRETLESMPPTHLAYANVDRQFPSPHPTVKNAHDVQSRAKEDDEQYRIMYCLDNNGDPVQTENGSKRPAFTIKVPNAEDWVFTGFLANPKLLEELEKLEKGGIPDGMLPTARLLPPQISKKKKRKQERRDAAMKKLAETDDEERIMTAQEDCIEEEEV